MEFSQDNKVIQLCSKGMELEASGQLNEAADIFNEAWNVAATDFEKFTAAHYVARHQKTTAGKLKWDETALQYALNINDENIKQTLPSLYLNIGKCYEDLSDFNKAKKNYEAAFSFTDCLPKNGYGKMIRTGIKNALERFNKVQL